MIPRRLWLIFLYVLGGMLVLRVLLAWLIPLTIDLETLLGDLRKVQEESRNSGKRGEEIGEARLGELLFRGGNAGSGLLPGLWNHVSLSMPNADAIANALYVENLSPGANGEIDVQDAHYKETKRLVSAAVDRVTPSIRFFQRTLSLEWLILPLIYSCFIFAWLQIRAVRAREKEEFEQYARFKQDEQHGVFGILLDRVLSPPDYAPGDAQPPERSKRVAALRERFYYLYLDEEGYRDLHVVQLSSAIINAVKVDTTRDTLSAIVVGKIEEQKDRFESEMKLVDYALWAIPSLGFIGTVLGIGDALMLANRMIGADAANQPVEITRVTTALGLAFDTTFVALVLGIPATWLLRLCEMKFLGNLRNAESWIQQYLFSSLWDDGPQGLHGEP